MTLLERVLSDQRMVVEVPVSGVADWVVAFEVLYQEGLRTWAFPPTQFGLLAEALPLFGRRARLGACGVTDAAGVKEAVAAGAAFITSPVAGRALADAAGDVPFLPGALTPNEVGALAQVYDSVQVVPADALGTVYARQLPGMFPNVSLLVTGTLQRFQCEMWFAAGAAAVAVQEAILVSETDKPQANEPDDLRRRCQSFVNVVKDSDGN